MSMVFPDEAINFLRGCAFDPAASPGYEMISGSVSWSDERYRDFACLCRALGCRAAGALFAYRTSLIDGNPFEPLRFAWDEVRTRCPGWIGFRPERISPSSELQAYLQAQRDAE